MDTPGSKWVGAHMSISGGPQMGIKNISKIGGKSVAMFLKNQRTWTGSRFSTTQQKQFKQWRCEHDLGREFQILPHGSYLINLGNPDTSKRERGYANLLDDLRRCEDLGIGLYNLHPGSTVGNCTVHESIEFLAERLNCAISQTDSVTILLENMAGQGHTLGRSFDELKQIIHRVSNKSRIGICLDTCHLFAAGYQIQTFKAFESVLMDFDKTIGMSYLKGVHLNDSKFPLGSHKDRHENIGKGFIGMDCFRFIMNDPRFENIPLILETPAASDQMYADEIQLLYSLVT